MTSKTFRILAVIAYLIFLASHFSYQVAENTKIAYWLGYSANAVWIWITIYIWPKGIEKTPEK